MVFDYTDYRHYLKSVLAQRAAKNPKYSLRAMARSFSISPTLLSQISNGQRNLTPANAVRLTKKLGLNKREGEYFCNLVQYQDSKHEESKDLLLEKILSLRGVRGIHNLSLDAFQLLSAWYHFAILEMLNLVRFKPSARNISERLGISTEEADEAIQRLVRLGIIEPIKNGHYQKTHKGIKVESAEKNAALQSFHRQTLEKAITSLATQSPKERHIGSETFALDPAQIPEAQRRINEFLDDMAAFFDKGNNPTEVYHLGVQLFRLTRKEQV